MPDPATAAEKRAEAARVREAAEKEVSRHTRNPFTLSPKGGRALSALMLPFIWIWPSAGYGVITTTGRRSGKARRTCIRAIRRDDTVYLVMLRPPSAAITNPSLVSAWVLNIRANPHVRLRIRGGRFEGVARELKDASELQEARATFCEPVVGPDWGECLLHLRGRPSRVKIQEMNRYWFDTGIPLAVDLEL